MKCPGCYQAFRSKKKYLLHLKECMEEVESDLSDCEYRLRVIEDEIKKYGGTP